MAEPTKLEERMALELMRETSELKGTRSEQVVIARKFAAYKELLSAAERKPDEPTLRDRVVAAQAVSDLVPMNVQEAAVVERVARTLVAQRGELQEQHRRELADAEQAGYERGKREAGAKFAEGEEAMHRPYAGAGFRERVTVIRFAVGYLVRRVIPGVGQTQTWANEDQLEKIT